MSRNDMHSHGSGYVRSSGRKIVVFKDILPCIEELNSESCSSSDPIGEVHRINTRKSTIALAPSSQFHSKRKCEGKHQFNIHVKKSPSEQWFSLSRVAQVPEATTLVSRSSSTSSGRSGRTISPIIDGRIQYHCPETGILFYTEEVPDYTIGNVIEVGNLEAHETDVVPRNNGVHEAPAPTTITNVEIMIEFFMPAPQRPLARDIFGNVDNNAEYLDENGRYIRQFGGDVASYFNPPFDEWWRRIHGRN